MKRIISSLGLGAFATSMLLAVASFSSTTANAWTVWEPTGPLNEGRPQRFQRYPEGGFRAGSNNCAEYRKPYNLGGTACYRVYAICPVQGGGTATIDMHIFVCRRKGA